MSGIFVRIADMALGTDGGSMLLVLERADGSTAWLRVNRSRAARGGPTLPQQTAPDYDMGKPIHRGCVVSRQEV